MYAERKRYWIKKSFVIIVALSGALLNLVYGIDLWKALLFPYENPAVQEFMIGAVALNLGWIAVFLWLMFKPAEGRPIYLLAIVPILAGNVLHSLIHYEPSSGMAFSIVLNTMFGLLYAALYVIAFHLGTEQVK